MSKLKILLILTCVITLFSCKSSKMVSSKTYEETQLEDSVRTHIDTSKRQVISIDEVQTNYGDTLTGSMQFDEEQLIDSIESSGIKVVVSIKKTPTGTKAKVTAVAKPKTISNTHTQIAAEQKGIAETTQVKKNTAIVKSEKDIEVVGFPWKKLIFAGVCTLLISLIIYLLYKQFNHGKT